MQTRRLSLSLTLGVKKWAMSRVVDVPVSGSSESRDGTGESCEAVLGATKFVISCCYREKILKIQTDYSVYSRKSVIIKLFDVCWQGGHPGSICACCWGWRQSMAAPGSPAYHGMRSG